MLNQHPDDIIQIIDGCRKNRREAQKKLYKIFYSYSMSICMRYSNSREDAVEIMNDGFMKIFTYIGKFNTKKAFAPWLRKIMINNAIDHFNKNRRQLDETELAEAIEQTLNYSVIDSISYYEMLEFVRKLPPAYRVVFNLIAIEGYKHHEVAELLDISVGTSKSNYARAKKKLQECLFPLFEAEG